MWVGGVWRVLGTQAADAVPVQAEKPAARNGGREKGRKNERCSDAAADTQAAGRQAGKGTAERAELDTAVGIALLHRR